MHFRGSTSKRHASRPPTLTTVVRSWQAGDTIPLGRRTLPVVSRPYRERRRFLEELRLDGTRWRTPEALDDGEALWEAVSEHEWEGVVVKQKGGRYRRAIAAE
jgi:hypothetical protein